MIKITSNELKKKREVAIENAQKATRNGGGDIGKKRRKLKKISFASKFKAKHFSNMEILHYNKRDRYFDKTSIGNLKYKR